MAETIFTKILSGEIPCHRVYEDDHVLAFLDIMPLGNRAEDYAVDWHTYPMGHSVCIEEIADINEWLRARFRTPT